MELNFAQKRIFFEQGCVQIAGVVPPVQVHAALKAIHHSLGSEGMAPEKLNTYRAQSYCPEIQKSPAITDLLNKTPALELAESLVGTGNFGPVGAGQVALRFPTFQDPPSPPKPHIDGVHSPTNGVPKGTLHSFTMLACVLLSEVTEPFAGNFTVWPGTHHRYETYFREHDPRELVGGAPAIALPAPVFLTGKPGDLILAHYALGHAAALNVSHTIRTAIFFRLRHIAHETHKWECLTDIWKEYEALDKTEFISKPS